ncbi:hypothetical protein COV13_02240 [Candidatus Woesearchaeota archaeon CG10_big_fil_rev_8_21_14_0_10_32_9]|nr:MAG: hypothetical protein COV13_02240 [Candidatus Woesearchaeota archaeon CG10_big_fil_rev_8_21_14_0_10_32_9]
MITEANYRIVGTSHISPESKQKIKQTFAEFKPTIIAIELDKQRFHAITSKNTQRLGIGAIRQIGLTGYLFAVIGRALQKKLGNLVGMNPGEEMLLGATLAKNNNLKLALIDQEASITLRNMSKKVKFSEKMKIVLDVLLSPFSKQKIKIDISKVPAQELVDQLLEQMKHRYKGLYKVLLDDRNKYMARRIYEAIKQDPNTKILAIVGAGHTEGIKKYLNNLIASNVY